MEQGRFFYSTNGTDVHGPVTPDEIRQLLQQQVVGSGSFLCREGETEWQPLNPDAFRAPVSPPVAMPPPAPPPVPSHLKEQSSSEETTGVFVLRGVAWVVAIGGTLLMGALSHSASPTAVPAERAGEMVGASLAGLVLCVLLPYVFSLIFKGLARSLVRSIAMIVLSLFGVGAQLNAPIHRFEATAQALNDKTKDEARKEIASKGYFESDPKQADQNVEQLKSQLTDNSELSRLGRDMLGVTQEMLGKVKVSDAAEKACNFEVKTIESEDDIATRRALLMKLRDAQVDMKTFLENYDTHCRDAMAKENAPSTTVDAMIAGAHKGGHVDVLVNIWQEKIKLTDDYVARLDFLSKKVRLMEHEGRQASVPRRCKPRRLQQAGGESTGRREAVRGPAKAVGAVGQRRFILPARGCGSA